MGTSYIERIRVIFFIAAPIFIWFIDYNTNEVGFTLCIFKNLFGEECYGCGLLRGISAAFHLDFKKVYLLNRLNFITIPIIFIIYTKQLFNSFKIK